MFVLLCLVSCSPVKPDTATKSVVEVGATVREAMEIAKKKAKAGEFDYIIDNMLAKEFADAMIEKYGAANWREKLRKDKLESLPYYFGWLKNCKVRTSGDKVFLMGQHGCYAVYVKVRGGYLLLDLGQRLTSM